MKNKSINHKSRKHRHSDKKKCSLCFWKGGSCGACNNSLAILKGGNFYKNGYPIPGPIVGKAWDASVKDWPGVNGVGGDRNYLKYNTYNVDPQTEMKLNGGKRRNSKSKLSKRRTKTMKKRGKGKVGGLIPQNLVNLGRSFSYGLGSTYNALNGYPAPVNPLPYKDQLTNSKNFII
jgi:hypothetical protein